MFNPLAERFGGFTLDVAALPHNAKCKYFFTPDDDGLARQWTNVSQPWTGGERVWCNPPYSNIEPWVEKAHYEFNDRKRMIPPPKLIVMLLPANRTEQGWWQRQVEPYREGIGRRFRVEFLPGRPRFIKHGLDRVEPNQRPPFGCCLLIWGRTDAG